MLTQFNCYCNCLLELSLSKKESRWKQWPASLRPPPRVAHASTPGPKKESRWKQWPASQHASTPGPKVGENSGQLRFVHNHGWRTQAHLDQCFVVLCPGHFYTENWNIPDQKLLTLLLQNQRQAENTFHIPDAWIYCAVFGLFSWEHAGLTIIPDVCNIWR